ncbi:pectate lyase [candidate division KSB1 bacterium]
MRSRLVQAVVGGGLILIIAGCGGDPAADKIREAARTGLDWYADRQNGGGWATRYSTDLQIQWGEWRPVIPEIVTVQPPGTPVVGEVFLLAHRVLGDEKYLETAKRAGDLLVAGQQPNGGFPYELWLSPDGPRPVKQTVRMGPPEIREVWGSLEDGVTDAPIGFLLHLFDAGGDSSYFKAAVRGADFMVAAQYESGAWPQIYPPGKGGYSKFYTLNDGVVNDTVCRLLEVYHRTGDRRYLDSAIRGGKWLVSAQLSGPTYGWAEQYSLDMSPAPARAFEAASMSPRAVGWAMETLMALHLETGNESWLEPIPKVLAWLETAQISQNIWVVQYDVETGEPIYLTRDGQRATDPSLMNEHDMLRWWTGEMGLPKFVRAWRQLQALGRERYMAEREKGLGGLELADERDRIRRHALAALESQRPEGYWIEGGVISSRAFALAVGDLLTYLSAKREVIPPCDVCPGRRWYRY